MGYQPILQFFGNTLGGAIAFFSLSQHFESFRMGVFDPRDLYFYFSFISVMIAFNSIILRGKK